MRIFTILRKLLAIELFCLAMVSVNAAEPNTLSSEEKATGWKLLFDGQSTTNWRGFETNVFPTKGWHVEDGCLVNPKSNGRPNGSGGDIVTVQKYRDFEFRFEWRIAKGGNSGVQYLFQEPRPNPGVSMYGGDTGHSPMGFEYQVLDDPNYPRELKSGPTHLASALYALIPPANKVLHATGEFNEGRIIIHGNHVEHWLNGTKVLQCELGSANLQALIAKSKYKALPGFGQKAATFIALQDHGDEVAFRNLKIREWR